MRARCSPFKQQNTEHKKTFKQQNTTSTLYRTQNTTHDAAEILILKMFFISTFKETQML